VSHDLLAVRRLCDRMLVLYGGEPMTQGDTGELLSSLRHPYLRGLWQAIPDLDAQAPPRCWGNQVLREALPGACLLYDRCPSARDACKKAPPLESQERCHFPAGA